MKADSKTSKDNLPATFRSAAWGSTWGTGEIDRFTERFSDNIVVAEGKQINQKLLEVIAGLSAKPVAPTSPSNTCKIRSALRTLCMDAHMRCVVGECMQKANKQLASLHVANLER